MINLDSIASAAAEGLPLSQDYLGKLVQVSLVSKDLRRTAEGLLQVGVGPWRTFLFDDETCTNRTYMGKPGKFVFKNALADMPGLMWEIVQPLSGDSIYSDHLERHGEGVHHLLFDGKGRNWKEQNEALSAAGYTCIQSAQWRETVSFAYYTNDLENGVVIEIMNIGPGWTRPEPQEIYG